MWNSFDLLEMYAKKIDDRNPMETLHEASGRFGNRARAIYFIFKFMHTLFDISIRILDRFYPIGIIHG